KDRQDLASEVDGLLALELRDGERTFARSHGHAEDDHGEHESGTRASARETSRSSPGTTSLLAHSSPPCLPSGPPSASIAVAVAVAAPATSGSSVTRTGRAISRSLSPKRTESRSVASIAAGVGSQRLASIVSVTDSASPGDSTASQPSG